MTIKSKHILHTMLQSILDDNHTDASSHLLDYLNRKSSAMLNERNGDGEFNDTEDFKHTKIEFMVNGHKISIVFSGVRYIFVSRKSATFHDPGFEETVEYGPITEIYNIESFSIDGVFMFDDMGIPAESSVHDLEDRPTPFAREIYKAIQESHIEAPLPRHITDIVSLEFLIKVVIEFTKELRKLEGAA